MDRDRVVDARLDLLRVEAREERVASVGFFPTDIYDPRGRWDQFSLNFSGYQPTHSIVHPCFENALLSFLSCSSNVYKSHSPPINRVAKEKETESQKKKIQKRKGWTRLCRAGSALSGWLSVGLAVVALQLITKTLTLHYFKPRAEGLGKSPAWDSAPWLLAIYHVRSCKPPRLRTGAIDIAAVLLASRVCTEQSAHSPLFRVIAELN